MKKYIGIVVKKNSKRAQNKADELKHFLEKKNVEVIFAHDLEKFSLYDFFCVIILGGDGTFLSAARLIGNKDIPLMGIKFGEVGFLAETMEDDLFKAVDFLIKGKFSIEERMCLNVTVIREKKRITSVNVLNDVVINKSALSRLAYIALYIDSKYLTTFKGDGLIVGTPTGSTAYSLAAGGPIIHPCVHGIVLTPICPFTLTNRPLIIPESSKIEIRLEQDPTNIMLTFDGQEGIDINSKDKIIIKKSSHSVKMISFLDQSYYKILKTRLMWSGGKGY